MDGLSITIRNLSNLTWTRNNWHIGAGESEGIGWGDELVKTPAPILEKGSSTDFYAHSFRVPDFLKDTLFVVLGYYSEDGCFAIMLRQSFHLVDVGSSDTWAVWDGDWKECGNDSTQYIWRFKSSEVVAVPSLSESGASVNIIIRRIAKEV